MSIREQLAIKGFKIKRAVKTALIDKTSVFICKHIHNLILLPYKNV